MTQHFLPHPQRLDQHDGVHRLPDHALIALDWPQPHKLHFVGQQAQAALHNHAAVEWNVVAGATVPADRVGLHILFDPATEHAQGYRLTIDPDKIALAAGDAAGAFYGVQTLRQLVQQHGRDLPTLEIVDWPDLPARGILLDTSRDRVPTLDALFVLVDQLAGWKINQLQLYTEHTFAYQNHREVHASASPFTAEEILALDAYCAERFVDLVPNQNSFGHLARWFQHARYRPMAEVSQDFTATFGSTTLHYEHPFTLAPTQQSLDFVDGLFAELLPNFRSPLFNVNCDETFDLGQGQSADAVAKHGQGRVYVDFLKQIYERINARGRTMMYWGDIIGHYPDLVPEMPSDAVALEWGYEADHPFAEQTKLFADAGVPFYICPGTSSWNSIAGRTDNAVANIRSAVEHGLARGAVGILNTDWGDHGHWQPPVASTLGYAYGAALGWAFAANVDLDLPSALDRFAFQDAAGKMGQIVYNLGNAYQQPGVTMHNNSLLSLAYVVPLDARQRSDIGPEIATWFGAQPDLATLLHDTIRYIDDAVAQLNDARLLRPDAKIIRREVDMMARLLRHGARRLLAIIGDDSVSPNKISVEEAARELAAIEPDYRELWLTRSRPGGLDDSADKLFRRASSIDTISVDERMRLLKATAC